MLDELEKSGLGWFWASDAAGNLSYISAAIAERLDVPLAELLGPAGQYDLFCGRARRKGQVARADAGRAQGLFGLCGAGRAQSRKGRCCALPASRFFTDGDRFAGFRGTGADITDEFHREEETARLGALRFRSPGFRTATAMAHQIETTLTAFKAARRNCAVMMLDLDRFKHVK